MGLEKQTGQIKDTITETILRLQRDLEGDVPQWLVSEMMVSQLESSGIGNVRNIKLCTDGVMPPAAVPLAIIDNDTVIYRNGNTGHRKGRQIRGNPSMKKWFGFQLGSGEFTVKRGILEC